MSPTGEPRISRSDAEQLLSGVPTAAVPAALPALLAAAASPPVAAELSGAEDVLAAFRSAHLASVRAGEENPSVIRSAVSRLAAAKVVAGAALATAATGGIALAAANGSLPFQAPHPASHPGAPAVTEDSGAPSGATSGGTSTGGSPSTGNDSTEAPPPSSVPAGTPSPSLVGLCHAYQAGAMAHGKVAQNPAFTALITAAGGSDNVAAYCVTLIGPAPTHPGGRPSDLPTHPGGRPSTHHGAPITPPEGPPGILPTHPVVSHPTGRPTSVPPVSHPTPPTHP